MITVRIRLTPVGHYFLGGERDFAFDEKLKRQTQDSYFISSLKVPSQTTLFGALRYLIGVKEEKLRNNAVDLIGDNSYDIVGDDGQFGIIKSISPLYLLKDGDYFIRTPFDHVSGKSKYTPFDVDQGEGIETISFPGAHIKRKKYPANFVAKDGVSKSYMSVTDKQIVSEDKIFKPSVEVVSRKIKNDKDGFAKKEYVRLEKGWSFAVFANLDSDQIPDYNRSLVLGKDSSVFMAEMESGKEPDVSFLFKDREQSFYYLQSPAYINRSTGKIIENSNFSVLESETIRRFKTKNSRLEPEYGADLIQLISAGSVIYSDDEIELTNDHAEIAGFNRIVNGGKK